MMVSEEMLYLSDLNPNVAISSSITECLVDKYKIKTFYKLKTFYKERC